MKLRFITTVILVNLLVGVGILSAQNVNTLFELDGVPQRLNYNPAMKPTYRAYVTFLLPSFGLNVYSSTSLSDLLKERAASGLYSLDFDAIPDENTLDLDVSYELLGGGFYRAGHFWNFGLNTRLIASVEYPGSVFGFFVPSQTSFSLSGLSHSASLFADFYIGYVGTFSDKWKAGIRVHYLQGISTYGSISKANLSTNQRESQLDLVGDIYSQTEELTDIFSDWTAKGVLIDLGAVYEFNNRITLHASVKDLGFIRVAYGYNKQLRNLEGAFEGADEESLSSLTREEIFRYRDSTLNVSYSQAFSPTMFWGGRYILAPQLKVGQVFSLALKKNIQFKSTTSIKYAVKQYIDALVSLNLSTYNLFSVGAGVSLNFSPIQLFVATDDIISAISLFSLRYGNVYSSSIRVGFNWVFTYEKDKDIQLEASLQDF